MKKLSFPLRYIIPIVIFLVLMVVSLFELRTTLNFFLANVERTALNHSRYEGGELSGTLEYFFRIHNREGAEKSINRSAEDPDLLRAFFLNADEEVSLSTRYDYLKRPIAEIATPEEIQIMNQARDTLKFHQELSMDRNTVRTAFPVVTAVNHTELRPTFVGILYLEHDLRPQKILGKQIAFENFYKFSAIFGIFCFLLWLFFEWSLMGRIKKLVEGSKRVAQGDYLTKVNFTGSDELAYLGNSFDLMTQKIRRNSMELEQREEQIRLLLNSTGEPIYGIDIDGRCTFVNDAFLKLLGFEDAKELKGSMIHDKIRPCDKQGRSYQENECPIMSALQRDEGVHLSEEFIWKCDGASFPAELWSHPIIHNGTTLGAVVTFIDITERQQKEVLRQHLSHTEKLSAIGTFVSGVAHELNNPLTAVLGYSRELLDDKGISEESRKFLEIIAAQTNRATNIVKSLLEFSRKETKGKTIADINEVLETTLSFQSYRFRTDKIAIKKDLSSDLSPVEVDINQFQQVFINIILNAHHVLVKEEGEKELKVITSMKGKKVCIEIENSGLPIPEGVLPRIFDPFYTTKGVGDGTGLGLYISFGIVTEHGGSIRAKNLLPKGVSFEILLPATVKRQNKQEPEIKQAKIPAGTRLLLVEEEEDIRNVLASSLIKQGVFTMATGSVDEAKKLLVETKYEVIISSVFLSKEEGLGEWLLENKPECLSKLIYASDYVDEEIKEFCGKNYCLYISKPYCLEDIMGKINAVLARKNENDER